MTGTDKQITEAEAIRDQFLNGKIMNGERYTRGLLGNLRDKEEDLQTADADDESWKACLQTGIDSYVATLQTLDKIESAAWWIDNASMLLSGNYSYDSIRENAARFLSRQ